MRKPLFMQGEYGIPLMISTGLDCSAAGPFGLYSSATFYLRKPDGTESTVAGLTLDPAGGDFYFEPVEGYFDNPGAYQARLEVLFPKPARLSTTVEGYSVGSI